MGASVDEVDSNQSVFEFRIERKTAPGPVLGMIGQFSFQRIHVQVVELFDSLLQTPHVKVVKPPLPKSRERIVATGEEQTQLRSGRSPLAAQAARDTLFQNLNDRGRGSFSRLADEQVDMLRHDDVTHQGEPVTVAHFVKNMDESISSANRAQQRQASVTTEGDEMQMVLSVPALQSFGQRRSNQEPRP